MGRLLRDVLLIFVQTLVLVGLGYVVGMDASVRGAALGIGLTLLLGGACSAASYGLALTTKSEDVMAPVLNSIFLPVLLLSGILIPITLAPQWLVTASDFMPIKHVVNGVRSSFAGDIVSSPTFWGTAWAVILTAVAVWWGTSTFRKENA
jgi:ABC-2 type transport system permease protein